MLFVRLGRSGGLGCLILGVLFFVALYFILKGFFALLFWAAFPLFVLALIIDWHAVADTGRALLGSMQRSPTGWLLVAALAFVGIQNTGIPLLDGIGTWVLNALKMVGFPLLALFMFLRSLGYTRLQEFNRWTGEKAQAPEEEFVEFEELESRPKNAHPVPEEPLEPPRAAEKEAPKPENPYDQMFK